MKTKHFFLQVFFICECTTVHLRVASLSAYPQQSGFSQAAARSCHSRSPTGATRTLILKTSFVDFEGAHEQEAVIRSTVRTETQTLTQGIQAPQLVFSLGGSIPPPNDSVDLITSNPALLLLYNSSFQINKSQRKTGIWGGGNWLHCFRVSALLRGIIVKYLEGWGWHVVQCIELVTPASHMGSSLRSRY